MKGCRTVPRSWSLTHPGCLGASYDIHDHKEMCCTTRGSDQMHTTRGIPENQATAQITEQACYSSTAPVPADGSGAAGRGAVAEAVSPQEVEGTLSAITNAALHSHGWQRPHQCCGAHRISSSEQRRIPCCTERVCGKALAMSFNICGNRWRLRTGSALSSGGDHV